MSPQVASSSKWDQLPDRDRTRPAITISQAASRLGYTRTAVERAVYEGRLEGCRDTATGQLKIAVYVDALGRFPVRPRSATAGVATSAISIAPRAVRRRPAPKQRSRVASAGSDGTRPGARGLRGAPKASKRTNAASDVVAIIVQLVDSIERYEESSRRTDIARALLDAAQLELRRAADERSAGTATLRALVANTLMPDTVADLLRRLDRTDDDGAGDADSDSGAAPRKGVKASNDE